MQNPFRHRNDSEFARSRPDDDRYEPQDRALHEGRSWNGGDGGRSAERFTSGQYARDDQTRGSSDPYGYGSQPSRGWDTDRQDRRAQWDRYPRRGDYSRNEGYGSGYGSEAGHDARFGQSSYDPRSERFEYGRRGSGSRDYDAETNYADGSEIWRDTSPMTQRRASRDYEPDYLHWRDEQVSKFDRDYDDWRSERRQKFSSDFDSWRQSRADNPIVGDVTDGGTGSSKNLKKD